MSNEVVTLKKDITKEHDLSIIEQVVMQGDLSKLNPEQRVTYYHTVCKSIGLNPYTRPFDYISLNGKLTLYAKKDATEQLRGIRDISITGLEGGVVEDLYIVKAKATMPNGRTDESTGAVSIGILKGEHKANAIMKAETKAKRRVTLSICGLGWVDESEIESIPNAQKVTVDLETGEIKENLNTIDYTPNTPEPPKKPEPVPSPGYAEFVAKHGLTNDKILNVGSKMDFVTSSASKTNMNLISVINFAMKNEADFEVKFKKWHQEKFPQKVIVEVPTSMDEVFGM